MVIVWNRQDPIPSDAFPNQCDWLVEQMENKASLMYRVKTLLRFVIKSVTVNSSGRPHDEKATNSAILSKPWPQRLFPVPTYLGVDKILQNYQVHFAEKSTDLPVLQSEYITLQGTMVSLIPQSTKNHCEKSLLFSLF